MLKFSELTPMVQMSMLILPLTGKGLEGVIQLVVMIVDGMTAVKSVGSDDT